MVFPVTAPGVYADGEPNFGGTIGVKNSVIEYTDTTAKDLFVLPRGAVILDFYVNVSVAFDDTGTDLIDVGDAATADRYIANLDASSTGTNNGVADPTEILQTPYTEPVTVQGVFTGSNADATAGTAEIAVMYVLLTPA